MYDQSNAIRRQGRHGRGCALPEIEQGEGEGEGKKKGKGKEKEKGKGKG